MPPLTDRERAQIALDRFAPLARGEGLEPVKRLAKKYGRAEAVISRAVGKAFETGLVEIRSLEPPLEDAPRVPQLERELLSGFAQLQKAVVIDEPDGAPRERSEALRGDRVHRRLGQAAAALLADGALLRRGDVIGLGSGRGVYYTVDAMRRFPHLQIEDVTLMSLTGAAFPEAHSEHLNVLLDADIHVALLAMRFTHPVLLRTISHPIAHDNEPEVRRRTWLDPAEYEKRLPTHALVGVGVLEGSHRFFKAVAQGGGADPGMLAPIFEPLQELVRLADAVRSTEPPYCPVADVCNRLFFVAPPARHAVTTSQRLRIERAIEAVNERLLTIHQDQLEKIENVVLVAGTRRKALAIRRLLDNRSLKVRILCTDATAAREILAQRP